MTNTWTADSRQRNLKTTLFLWGPPAFVFLVILVLSLTPGSMYPEHPEIFNVIIHFLEFVVLACFIARAFVAIRMKNVWGSAMLTVFVCALIAIMTEVLQFTVPQRMFDVFDILVDISGAFTGVFLYISIARLKGSIRLGTENPPGIDNA